MARIQKHIATICAEAGKHTEAPNVHTEPIYATSAYLFEDADDAMRKLSDKRLGYVYSRWANPTVDQAAERSQRWKVLRQAPDLCPAVLQRNGSHRLGNAGHV